MIPSSSHGMFSSIHCAYTILVQLVQISFLNLNELSIMSWKTLTLDKRDVKSVSLQLNSVSMNEPSCREKGDVVGSYSRAGLEANHSDPHQWFRGAI